MFENMIKSYFQATRPECKTESYLTTGIQKKIHCFTVDEYCNHCETVCKTMGCNFLFCPCHETRSSLLMMLLSNEEPKKKKWKSFNLPSKELFLPIRYCKRLETKQCLATFNAS